MAAGCPPSVTGCGGKVVPARRGHFPGGILRLLGHQGKAPGLGLRPEVNVAGWQRPGQCGSVEVLPTGVFVQSAPSPLPRTRVRLVLPTGGCTQSLYHRSPCTGRGEAHRGVLVHHRENERDRGGKIEQKEEKDAPCCLCWILILRIHWRRTSCFCAHAMPGVLRILHSTVVPWLNHGS